MQREEPVDVNAVKRQANTVLQDHEGQDRDEVSLFSSPITKKHWKPDGSRLSCSNTGCNTKFSLIERRTHCRRCGDLFCSNCCQYKRKLNAKAEPDPINGRMYRVCAHCFNEVQKIGQKTIWTDGFLRSREMMKLGKKALPPQKHIKRRSSLSDTVVYRPLVDVPDELQRLLNGFKKEASSRIKATLSDFFGTFSVPDYEKSGCWENSKGVHRCSGCNKSFTILQSKHHCRICGLVFCDLRQCSSDHLLLYFPGEMKGESLQWALNGKEGCPDQLPSLHKFFRVCSKCIGALERRKIQEFQLSDEIAVEEEEESALSEILLVHSQIVRVQLRIKEALGEYQDTIHEMGIDETGPTKTPSSDCIRMIARRQGDLSDSLTRFAVQLQKVQKIKPCTHGQAVLLKGFVRCKADVYHESMWTFRRLKRTIEAHLPEELLKHIQATVDLNCIRNAHLVTRQLVLELEHLAKEHGFDFKSNLIKACLEPAEISEREFKNFVTGCDSPEEWDDVSKIFEKLLQLHLEEHRLISLSKRKVARTGERRAVKGVMERINMVLVQTNRQLKAKSSAKLFKGSKTSVSDLINVLESLTSRRL